MAQNGDRQNADSSLESAGTTKKKNMSSNLLNMKVNSPGTFLLTIKVHATGARCRCRCTTTTIQKGSVGSAMASECCPRIRFYQVPSRRLFRLQLLTNTGPELQTFHTSQVTMLSRGKVIKIHQKSKQALQGGKLLEPFSLI